MSCYWDVKCLDCNEKMGISNANHNVELMWSIIHHAKRIAAIVLFIREINRDFDGLRTFDGDINVEWLAKHCEHRLAPINEYGEVDEEKA